jgi:hypothetical protein
MLTKIYWFTFVFIAISFITNPQSPTASTTADVKYDGKRLSVHADGVALGQLLSMVKKHTGIQFSYNELLAEMNVYANFENNVLPDGIRRILLQFNYAAIYDGSGHIKKVWVLNRQRGSSKSPVDQARLNTSQQETEINDMSGTFSDPVEAPPEDISTTLPDPEQSSPFPEQVFEQGAKVLDIPPGAEQHRAYVDMIPPPGAESVAPVVNQNLSPPPGAEPLAPVVNQNLSPPPGAEPLAPVVNQNLPPQQGAES